MLISRKNLQKRGRLLWHPMSAIYVVAKRLSVGTEGATPRTREPLGLHVTCLHVTLHVEFFPYESEFLLSLQRYFYQCCGPGSKLDPYFVHLDTDPH